MESSGKLGQCTLKLAREVKFYIRNTLDPGAPTRKKLKALGMGEKALLPSEAVFTSL